MGTAEFKNELHERIEHADAKQVQRLYGLILDFFGSQTVIGGDDEELTDVQQKMIAQGLQEADAGLGSHFEDVTKRIREKHGLNG